MQDELKKKAVSGMLWTGLERFGSQLIQFVIGILIARQLVPGDYGIIGMLAIFIGIAQTFIDSGFSNALIQKKDCSRKDFSTVFFFSIWIAVGIYLLLFFCSPLIADFYRQPLLAPVTKLYMLTLVINSLSIVPTAILTINLRFTGQAVVSILSVVFSGGVGLLLAYMGFGVWALVWQGITMALIRVIGLSFIARWLPSLIFSKKSFSQLFSFGGKLLASSLINNIYNNISTIVIGKIFSPSTLGLFTRANQFCQFPTNTITGLIVKVNYPILSKYQDEEPVLLDTYKIFLRGAAFVLFPILFGLSVLGYPFIDALLGEKWIGTVGLIPILAFGCLWNPLTHINLNLLYVKGRTDLVLKLELIKKPIAFVLLFCSIKFGLFAICISLAVYDFIAFTFNCYYTGKILGLGLFRQMREIIPILFYAVIMSVCVASVYLIFDSSVAQLLVGVLVGVASYVAISLAFRDRTALQILSRLRRVVK